MLGSVIADGLTLPKRLAGAALTACLRVLSGPNRGHYITIVKSHGFWLLFDDDIVEVRHSHCLSLSVCVGPPCAPSTQPVCLCVGLGVCVWCRKSTPRPSRSFTALPQTSPRTPSRDTSSSTSPGTDQSPWQEKTERDSCCCFVLFCFFE